MPAEALPMSLPERDDLRRLEEVVERGRATFVAVGSALAQIRDRRLYRGTHATFEAYCLDRWVMHRLYADRLINAAGVVGGLIPTGIAPPDSERQARPLVGMDPGAAAEALEEARETAAEEGRPVTAGDIDLAAVARRAGLDPAATRRPPADPRLKAVAAIARAVRTIRGQAGRLDAGEQEDLERWLALVPEWVGEGPVTVEG